MTNVVRARFSAFISLLVGGILLSACLTGAGTGAVRGGALPADAPDATIAAKEETPSSEKTPDETASHPGPGGSMPSGTLAPYPDVPVNIDYKAEGTYCRFEGDDSRAMIWGRLSVRMGSDEPGADLFVECLERCQGKHLYGFYQSQQQNAAQEILLDDAPHFQFVLDAIDDPKQFGMILVIQQAIAIIDQISDPPPKGFFVNVSGLEPYTVNGSPAFCPSKMLMEAGPLPQNAVPLNPVNPVKPAMTFQPSTLRERRP